MSLLEFSGGNLIYLMSNTTYFIKKQLSVIHLFANGGLKLEHIVRLHIICSRYWKDILIIQVLSIIKFENKQVDYSLSVKINKENWPVP